MTGDTDPIFIDFEASSLSGSSYPIEVAWGSGPEDVHSCLISPAQCHDCIDWDDDSEFLHGLTRRQVLEQGVPMDKVCDLLTDALNGRQVYSDANGYDNFWLEKLFHAAGKGRPGFRIRHVDELLCERLAPFMVHRRELVEAIEELHKAARDKVPRRHRAGWDVRFLIELWGMVCRKWL
jgi:hypothetical protein